MAKSLQKAYYFQLGLQRKNHSSRGSGEIVMAMKGKGTVLTESGEADRIGTNACGRAVETDRSR